MAVGAAVAAAKSVLEHLLEVGISCAPLVACLSLLFLSQVTFWSKPITTGGV